MENAVAVAAATPAAAKGSGVGAAAAGEARVSEKASRAGMTPAAALAAKPTLVAAALPRTPCCSGEDSAADQLPPSGSGETAPAAVAAVAAAEPGISTASNTPDNSPLGAPSKLTAAAAAAGSPLTRQQQQQQQQLQQLQQQIPVSPLLSIELQHRELQQQQLQLERLGKQLQLLPVQSKQPQQLLLRPLLLQQQQQAAAEGANASAASADLSSAVAAAVASPLGCRSSSSGVTAAPMSTSSNTRGLFSLLDDGGLAALAAAATGTPHPASLSAAAGSASSSAGGAAAGAAGGGGAGAGCCVSSGGETPSSVLDTLSDLHERLCVLLDVTMRQHNEQRLLLQSISCLQQGGGVLPEAGALPDSATRQAQQQQMQVQQQVRRAQQQSLGLDSQLLGLAADLGTNNGSTAAALQHFLLSQTGVLPPPRTPTATAGAVAAQQALSAALLKAEGAAAEGANSFKQLKGFSAKAAEGKRRQGGSREQQQLRLAQSALRRADSHTTGNSEPQQLSVSPSTSVYSRGSNAQHLHDPFPHSTMIQLIQPLPTGIKLELKSHKAVKGPGNALDGSAAAGTQGIASSGPAPREYALRVSLTRHETKYCSFHSLHGIMPAYNEAVRLRNRYAGLPFQLPLMTEAVLRERKLLLDQGRPLPLYGPKEAFMTVQERTIFYKQGRLDASVHDFRSHAAIPAVQQQSEQQREQQLRDDPEATSALRGLGVFTAPTGALQAQQAGRTSKKRQRDRILGMPAAATDAAANAGAAGKLSPKARKSERRLSGVGGAPGSGQWIAADDAVASLRAGSSSSSSSSSFGDGIADALLQFPAAAAAAGSGLLLDSISRRPPAEGGALFEGCSQGESEFGLLLPQQQQQKGSERSRRSGAEAEGSSGSAESRPVGSSLAAPSAARPTGTADWEATAVAADIAASLGLPLEELAARLSHFIRGADGRGAGAAAATAAAGVARNNLSGGGEGSAVGSSKPGSTIL
ncbi:uncharacterized protein LOC34618026 [Cyclospora cayetanensis]|uniref:Uncharacterized protein LOC34618026 n=1 Tax=Cyclospora cayetanensis TaxID=88456 RepID=A0A6P6RR00_9EIME|nr:uncharacterized protein LOC34618026 [Cyclospora cayetanensis]